MGSLNRQTKQPEREPLVFPLDNDALGNLERQFVLAAEQYTIAELQNDLLARESALILCDAVLDATISVCNTVDTPKPVTAKITDYGE